MLGLPKKRRDNKADDKSTTKSYRSTKVGEYPCQEVSCGKMLTTAQKRSEHYYCVHNPEGKKKKQEANKKL
jgi:hypothetical protein